MSDDVQVRAQVLVASDDPNCLAWQCDHPSDRVAEAIVWLEIFAAIAVIALGLWYRRRRK